jgi:hypothetical protein
MKSFSYYINNPRRVFATLVSKVAFIFPDKLYLQIFYYLKMGKRLNLKTPQTYNEKLQWLKLYNRRPEYTLMVDKYAVKDYVASIIGSDYIIPTLGVWDNIEDIEWDKLPDQFVLKTTHGGGNTGVVICHDKSRFNRDEAVNKLRKSLKQNLYQTMKEWPYKNVPKRIIAEEYVEPDEEAKDLPDYKFFCFDGVVKSLFVGTERGTGDVKFDYFDANFNHLDLIQVHPMSGKNLKKPEKFEEMKEVASRLSKGVPHVRIDLYHVNGKIFFGEMTFYHHGGVVPFHPEKWDYEFGSWLKLPMPYKNE